MVNKKPDQRTELDRGSAVQIPPGAYWGAQTARAREYAPVSGSRTNAKLVEAVVQIKKAAALVNIELGLLDATSGRAIAQVCDEILAGQWRDQFVVDALQCAAAASLLANADEVIANRGAEISGSKIGTYEFLCPRKHVSLSQSTGDLYPSAMRIALLAGVKQLEPVLVDLERLLRRKALEFERVIKSGRVHLQNSLPITLGQEFNAYGSSIERSMRRLKEAATSLLELNLGGGAIGTGFGVDRQFGPAVIERLSQTTGFKFRQAEDMFRVTQSLSDFVEVSSALKETAVELIKMGNDLKLLNSSIYSGQSEINLPGDESGPQSVDALSVIETLIMAGFQIMGNDVTVTAAAQAGQLELNAMMPLIIHNLLGSVDLLRQALTLFNHKCLSGITANSAQCLLHLQASEFARLLLTGVLGQTRTEALIKEAKTEGRSLADLIVRQQLISRDQLDQLLSYKVLTRPGQKAGGGKVAVSTIGGAALSAEGEI